MISNVGHQRSSFHRKISPRNFMIISQCYITFFGRFRMIVIETKSEIVEANAHEMAVARQINTASYINNGECSSSFSVRLSYTFSESKTGSGDTNDLLHHLLIVSSKCPNLLADGRPVSTFIHEGYTRLKPFLYPCTIEFSLICLTVSSPYF